MPPPLKMVKNQGMRQSVVVSPKLLNKSALVEPFPEWDRATCKLLSTHRVFTRTSPLEGLAKRRKRLDYLSQLCASKSVMHVSDCMEVKVPRRYSLLWETHITKMKEWSFLCWNEITYVDEVYATSFLSSGAKRILYEPNAGGNSEVSEAISFEILYRFFSASLDHTEMEIKYMFRNSKKTDYSVRIFGERVGVSVTRAMRYGSLISTEDAERLLRKKLSGILVSTENVITPHEWKRQILHIFCRNKYEAGIVAKAFLRMDRELKGSTIVMLTITNSLQVF
mmetsp:Transcript_42614/g.109638  ORF Transcript_42614/g.109638 Transcript_42614/m.109638 type:complete len:281 (-) Transcript_42614:637-1479(-)